MERVITVQAGSDLAKHISAIITKFGEDEAVLNYENIPYRIVKMWKSNRVGRVEIRLKQI